VTFNEHIKTDARICGSCGSVIESRDTGTQPATALESARVEYPIRQSWTFTIPRTSAERPTAPNER
jgi:hypothetical protein